MDEYLKEKVKLSPKLFNMKNLSRDEVHELILIINDFMNISNERLKSDLCKSIVDPSMLTDIKIVFLDYENPLQPINTEKKMFFFVSTAWNIFRT